MDLEELLAERDKSDSIRKKFSVNNVKQFFEGCEESPEAQPQLHKAKSQLYKQHKAMEKDGAESNSLLSSMNESFQTPPGQNQG